MRKWALLLVMVLPSLVRAQGVSVPIPPVMTVNGFPRAGATLSVCNVPVNAVPCTNYASVYADLPLTQLINQSTTPLKTDGLGNAPIFYIAPGNYAYTVSGAGITTPQGPFPVTAACITTITGCGGGGGGGGSPGGPAFSAQVANGGVTGFLGAGCLIFQDKDNGPVNLNCDGIFKGPSPYVDVRAYGVRALAAANFIPAVAGIIGTINATSTTLTVSTNFCGSQTGNVCFVNGDGIVVVGAGPAHTLATPTIATVVPSNPSGPDGTGVVATGPTAGTTYNYKLVSVDKGRGMTVPSATVSTTVGQASLGKQQAAMTSCARSGVTVTCTTAAHTIGVGALVYIVNSDGTFEGYYRTATVPDNTHFTYISGFDTASGATVSTTGGTVLWKNENYITWTHPGSGTAPQQYIVCSDRGGSGFVPIGISKVDNNAQGANDLALSFDDLGSPMMDNLVLPYWAGSNPCTASSVQNDELVTTIASGAGTTTLTLSASAITSVTGAPVLFDDGPNLVTAATAATATGKGPMNLPLAGLGSYVFNSYVTLPSFTDICQVGNILINDTMEMAPTGRYSGKCPPGNGSIQSFAWKGYPTISVGPAYPGFYYRASVMDIDSLSFLSVSGNQKVLMLEDAFNVPSGTMADLNFNTSATGDYTGMGLFLRTAGINSPSNILMSGAFAFIGGAGDGTNGSSTAPLFYSEGGVDLAAISFAKRGIAFKTGSFGQGRNLIHNIYENGGISPMVMYVSGGTSLGFTFGEVVGDTLPQPFFVNLASNNIQPLVVTDFITGAAFDGVGTPPNVTGFPLPVVGMPIPTGWTNAITGGNFTNNEVSVNGTTGSIGYALPTPLAPVSCVVSAGGSVGIATNIPYSIVAIDANGNFSPPSPPCLATTSSGQQTVTIVPPARPSGAVTYQVVRAASQQLVAVGPTRWTSNIVDTFGFTNGPIPNSSGQQAGFNATNAVMPQLVITGGGFKDVHNFTGTADRATTWPDVSGTVIKSGMVISAYDNFNRANENPLSNGGKWTIGSGTWTLTSNTATPTGASRNSAFWNANTFSADQFSQMTITTIGNHIGAAVRATAGGNDYSCDENTTTLFLLKLAGGTEGTLTSVGVTGANGDIIRAEVQGNQISCFQNGVLKIGPFTDNSYATGQPGIYSFSNTTALDNWSGGNLHPLAQLDVEQDYTQPQHVPSLTVGATNPIAGALPFGNGYVSGALAVVGALSTGAAPPACTIGTAGTWCANEGTAPTGLAAADEQWGDSTTHGFNYNANNGGVSSFSGAWNCTNVTPVTVSANVTTDQNLMTCTIPAGTLNRTLRTMKVSLAGVYSTPAASTAVITVKVKVGSLTVATWTSTALAGIQATNDQFNVEDAKFTVQTAGASGAFEAHGNLVIDLGVGNTVADSVFADVNTATVGTVDLTASQTLQVTIAFSAASASNTATQRQLVLETVN